MKKQMREVKFESQQDYDGALEKIDVSVFNIRVICDEPGCFQARYIKPQDRFQIKKCKPHTKEMRKRYRAEYMKKARSSKKQNSSV